MCNGVMWSGLVIVSNSGLPEKWISTCRRTPKYMDIGNQSVSYRELLLYAIRWCVSWTVISYSKISRWWWNRPIFGRVYLTWAMNASYVTPSKIISGSVFLPTEGISPRKSHELSCCVKIPVSDEARSARPYSSIRTRMRTSIFKRINPCRNVGGNNKNP